MPKVLLPLDGFLPYRLSVASNAVSQVIAKAYEEEHGLTMQEWRVVAVLAEGGELTQKAIVVRTRMDKVTVSRAARALEERGIVRRVPNREDGRSFHFSLSAEGRKIYVKVVPKTLELEKELFRFLTAKQQADLRDLLARVEVAAAEIVSDDT